MPIFHACGTLDRDPTQCGSAVVGSTLQLRAIIHQCCDSIYRREDPDAEQLRQAWGEYLVLTHDTSSSAEEVAPIDRLVVNDGTPDCLMALDGDTRSSDALPAE